MHEAGDVGDTDACSLSCVDNPLCAGWAVKDGTCFHGIGARCFSGTPTEPQAAQRIVHGRVRVLMQLPRIQIYSLRTKFPTGFYVNQSAAISECAKVCYSNLLCQYWTYSDAHGCLVEEPQSDCTVQFPLTESGLSRTSPFAHSVVAGEYVQHFCPARVSAPAIQQAFEVEPQQGPLPASPQAASAAQPAQRPSSPSALRTGAARGSGLVPLWAAGSVGALLMLAGACLVPRGPGREERPEEMELISSRGPAAARADDLDSLDGLDDLASLGEALD